MHRLAEAPGRFGRNRYARKPIAARRRLIARGAGELPSLLPRAVMLGGACRTPRRPTQLRTA
jgi:hypothetical protein